MCLAARHALENPDEGLSYGRTGGPTLQKEIKIIDGSHASVDDSPCFGISVVICICCLRGIEACVVSFTLREVEKEGGR